MTVTGSSGLLRRASKLRSQSDSFGFESGFDAADQSEGITAEDRREILQAIEKVATGNRITASSESMALRPLHKGFVFPLIVNLLAISLTVGILFGLSYFFRQKDRGIEAGGVALTSAEGKLIEEIRRESDSQLQAKDKAIADIQSRLTSLDQERNALAASIEARVKQREAVLQTQMQAELDKERQRLSALGISAASIQDQMKKFEAQKNAELKRQLDDFTQKALAERAQADANYAKLRNEYQTNISALGADRQKILDEAQRREDQLRASLDAKTKTLENQNAAAQAGLAQAQAQLAQLNDQRRQQQAIEDRVLGLYDSIRQALRDRRFEDAAAGASALGAYLNDPSVAGLPSIQGRRAADLFVADALSTLAKEELDRSSADANKLLAQAELLSAVRADAAAADKALQAGDLATAQAKYQEALATVPEILAAHNFFLGQLQDQEAARKARLDDALNRADAAFISRDFTTASRSYAEALAYLPIDEARRQAIVQRLASMGSNAADRSRVAADTIAAREPLAAARRNLAAGRWNDAVTGFLALLASYPFADQGKEALAGIASAQEGMKRDAAAQASADAARIAALQAASDKTTSDITAQNQHFASTVAQAQGERDAAKSALVEAQRQVADLTAKLKAATEETAAAAAKSGAATPAATQAAASGDYAALLKEKNRLAALADRYDALLVTYADFSKQVQTKTGAAGFNARLSSLYAFLDSPETRSAFPILKDFIQKSLQDYQANLPVDDVNNAANISAKALGYSDKAARKSFLDEQLKRYSQAGDTFLVNFITTLDAAIK
jgi:hypothetical protein